MKLPAIHGYIERRILINFTADPEVVKNIIPEPFRPKIYKGKAIVGVCLIRLKNIKPKGFPDLVGIASENAAHRIAVEWDDNSEQREGVYIPRRDTSSKLNAIAGGRIFPGKHHHTKFHVTEGEGNYQVNFTSSDYNSISLDAKEAFSFDKRSIFETIENASAFFKNGCIGYSPNGNNYEGLELRTYDWKVKPLQVANIHSSFFENKAVFAEGSISFDNALLMTNIEHEWRSIAGK